MSKEELNFYVFIGVSIILGIIIIGAISFVIKSIIENKKIDSLNQKDKKENDSLLDSDNKQIFKLDKVEISNLKFKELDDVVIDVKDDHNLNFLDDYEDLISDEPREEIYINSTNDIIVTDTKKKKSFKDFRRL